VARTDQSLYGAARIGDFDVISFDRPTTQRWALILLATAALALSGCGRKGPLDLPPTASGQQQPAAAAVQSDQTAPPQTNSANLFDPNNSAGTLPTAGKGPKRPFALDPLLNSN
jgi:predicted small lipoprotein YifL